MDFVSMDLVSAKKAGKALIVVFWTKRPDNVFLIVQVTEFLTSRLKNAIASKAGSATIVYPNCATWIVDLMEDARIQLVFAKPVGEAIDARNKIVILVAAFMANVRTAHVYVWSDGMAFIVL
jgi:hypothetical protein